MQLVENKGLRAPSICIICETVPDGPSVVDTGYQLRTGTFSPMEGEKFVCERCVDTTAKLFGYEKGEAVEQARMDKEFAERQVLRIKGVVKDFAEFIAGAIDHPGVADEQPEVRSVEKVQDGEDSEVESPVSDEPVPVHVGTGETEKVESTKRVTETGKESPGDAKAEKTAKKKVAKTAPKDDKDE